MKKGEIGFTVAMLIVGLAGVQRSAYAQKSDVEILREAAGIYEELSAEVLMQQDEPLTDEAIVELSEELAKRFGVPADFQCTDLQDWGTSWGADEQWAAFWTKDNSGEELGKEIRIVFTPKGQVIQYFTNYYDEERENQSTLSKEACYEKVCRFLEEKGQYDLKELELTETVTDSTGYIFFKFQYSKSGIPVYNETVDVGIYTSTGRIVLMNGILPFSGEYELAQDIITGEKVAKAYAESMPIELIYEVTLEKENPLKLSYHVMNPYHMGMDAITGKPVVSLAEKQMWPVEEGPLKDSVERELDNFFGPSLIEEVALNEQELANYVKQQKLMSPEEAGKVAAKYFPHLKNALIEKASLHRTGENYYWKMTLVAPAQEKEAKAFEQNYNAGKLTCENILHISLICEAKTGQPMAYENSSISRQDGLSGNLPSEAQTKKAQEMMAAIGNVNFKQTEARVYDAMNQGYQYTQLINQIPLLYHGVALLYNHQNQEVINYSENWYQGTIPTLDLTRVKSKEDIVKTLDLKLYYMIVSKEKAALVYFYSGEQKCFEALK